MRDFGRIGLTIKALWDLWEKHPDQRLGQLLENYVFKNGQRGDKTSVALFYQEEPETIRNIINELEQISSKQSQSTEQRNKP